MNFPHPEQLMPIIELALREDIGGGDVTSSAVFHDDETSEARIVAKENGVFCGGEMVNLIYRHLDPRIAVDVFVTDGARVARGTTAVECRGSTLALLAGERTVLNFIQRMSGIATRTRTIVDLLEESGIRILDTRKTAPGMRLLDKYAVAAGGGLNHRMGLYDMIMIKDNHIKAAGSISRAVERARGLHGTNYRIEVETTTLDEVREALEAGADIIMLDNMDVPAMEEAVGIIGRRSETEISGNLDEERIAEIKHLKVDYISIGALTHSVRAFDLSMRFL